MTINYKVFAAGDTLSANDVLTYLENQAVIKVDAASELPTLASTYPNVKVAYAADTDKVYVNDDGTYVALVTADGTVTLSNLTLTGNLTVQGTTTTIDSTTIAIKDKFVFEGATPDAFETELVVAEPTADRTITLPNKSGTVALTSDIPATGGLTLISATSASSISSLVFNNLGSYKQLILVWAGVRHNAANNQFSIRLNNDSGTNYDISYHGQVAGADVTMMYDGNALGNSGAHSMSAFGTGTSDTTSYHDCVGQILLDNPISTTKNKSFKGMFAYYDAQNGGRTFLNFTGQYKSSSAITSIDIVRTAGSSTFSNQGNSEIRLYGLN